MTVVSGHNAQAPLAVTVVDMFKRSDRKWIIAGSLEGGSLREGQRVRLQVEGQPSIGAMVTGFNLESISLPQVDFVIETDRPIERRLPAKITSDS